MERVRSEDLGRTETSGLRWVERVLERSQPALFLEGTLINQHGINPKKNKSFFFFFYYCLNPLKPCDTIFPPLSPPHCPRSPTSRPTSSCSPLLKHEAASKWKCVTSCIQTHTHLQLNRNIFCRRPVPQMFVRKTDGWVKLPVCVFMGTSMHFRNVSNFVPK